MDDKERRGLNGLAPWGTMLIALLSAVYVYGTQASRIDKLESDVASMQADNRTNAATLAEIKETTTVIKTKLEILLPTSTIDKSGARR